MTGAVIALAVKQPALAIPLSFASHFAADAIPHFGFKLEQVLGRKFNAFHTADFVLSISLMAILGALFPAKALLIWACMIAAAIPDLAWWFNRKSVRHWPGSLDKITKFHWDISSHINHLYFDAVWFASMWAIIIFIKLR